MAQDKELEFYKNLQIMSKVYAEIAKDKLTLAEKNMLLKYLCMALPYKVIVEIKSYGQETQKPWFGELSCKDLDCFLRDVAYKSVKPYLRPLSSMTDEEDDTYRNLLGYEPTEFPNSEESLDFALKKHLDFLGLIPMGLAIDCTGLNVY